MLLEAACQATAIAFPATMAEGLPLSLRLAVATCCADHSVPMLKAFKHVFPSASLHTTPTWWQAPLTTQ
jgi:hypothetical protein